MKKMLENRVENRLVKLIKEQGGLALKFDPSIMNGMPDRQVLLPYLKGRMIWVELKRPGEELRPLQAKRKKDLEAMGYQVEKLDSVKEVELFVKRLKQEYDI